MPVAGFADATLASLIQKRVPQSKTTHSHNASSQATTSQSPSSQTLSHNSSHTNTGAITGGVLGGVVALALVIAIVWYRMVQRKKGLQEGQNSTSCLVEPSELPGESRAELASKLDMHAEMQGENRHVAELA